MAFLMAFGSRWSRSVFSTREGTSSSAAKRRAMSCCSVRSEILGRSDFGQQRQESQPLFEADHTVLHFERVNASLKQSRNAASVKIANQMCNAVTP